MNVPKFPPPPNIGIGTKVANVGVEGELAAAAKEVVTSAGGPVSRETPYLRRRDATVRGAGRNARGATTPITGGPRGCRCFVKNLVHPRKRTSHRRRRSRVTEFRFKMTENRDDEDVVCATAGTDSKPTLTLSPKFINRPSEINMQNGDAEDRQDHRTIMREIVKSIGVQTQPVIPYRLRIFPSLTDDVPIPFQDNVENKKKSSRIFRHLRFLGRLTLCQFGLAWLISFWAIAGAAAFYNTEGPREREQVRELAAMQKELTINLATELRQVKAEDPIWGYTVEKYVVKHEKLLLAAVSSGYGESGGGGGQVWTFPGCFLFAVSLLTTLGFGAPVPRTTAGRTVAVIFAAVGIPAHFLLILNMGIFLAVRLQNFAIIKSKTGGTVNDDPDEIFLTSVPRWVKIVPFASIGGYYILGIICFGVARLRPTAASLLFPLDFTAAGGLATTSGPVRIAYAIYLEGAVTIAAVAVAILQVSATKSLTNVGLKYGLLTNTC